VAIEVVVFLVLLFLFPVLLTVEGLRNLFVALLLDGTCLLLESVEVFELLFSLDMGRGMLRVEVPLLLRRLPLR
jgi:hypothetical protein